MQFLARVLEGFCTLVQFFLCRAMLYGNKERKLKVYVVKNAAKKLSTCVFFSEVISQVIVEIVSEDFAGA